MGNKGLTEIIEIARGFVGGVSVGRTQAGKTKVIFDLGCGVSDETRGKYTTWRKCYIYGDKADMIKGIKTGDYVKVHGWLSTEAKMNEYYQYVTDVDTGLPVKETKLVCYSAELLEHTPRNTDKQLPLGVGQAS